MDKSELRQALISRRETVSERERKDMAITEKVLTLAAKYSSVFVYVSMGSEVSTLGIINQLSKSHTVYVPHTFGCEMHAVKYDGSSLIPDKIGNIFESPHEFYDGQAELTVVPLLGFNEDCYRIGYGKGCYDRYFMRHCGGVKAGIAYDEQLCDFNTEYTDIPLDEIITPTKIFWRAK